MANTTSEHQPPADAISVGTGVVTSDMQLFGDPGLALFGGSGSSSPASLRSGTSTASLYHGRHRAAE
jgi:hypothetical protein